MDKRKTEMKTPLIYLDTSVIGGCFDVEFEKWSNGLFKDIKNGHYHPTGNANDFVCFYRFF